MRLLSKALLLWVACFAAGAVVHAQPPPAAPVTLVPPSLQPGAHGHPPFPEGLDFGPARVVLRITVGPEGKVTRSSVLSNDAPTENRAQFEALAVEYVTKLKFAPATRNGEPIAATVRFEVRFDPPGQPHTPHPDDSPPHPPHDTPDPKEGVHAEVAEAPDEPPSSFSATAVVPQADLSASSIDLTGDEIRLRPYLTTGDLLNAAPGVYSIQHAGGGKANQYFLRGFDADHGSDIAFYVDGVPINWVSHGHGQGYTDLNFVIPELIERLEVRKGPYFAEYGDFSTAGTINVTLNTEKPTSSFSVLGGTYRTFRGVGIVSPKVDGLKPLLAVEVLASDGPFDKPENQFRFNLFARTTFDFSGDTTFAITGSAYGNNWDASGQIPLREVNAGNLSRFGYLDPNEGGESQRFSLYVNVLSPAKAGAVGR